MKEEKKRAKRVLKKANLLMDLRGYEQKKKQKMEGMIDIIALNPKTEKRVLMRGMTKSRLSSGKIGVRQVRKMNKILEKSETDKGVLIGGKFTWSARKEAKREDIELVSKTSFPSFNIFDHELVPKHEILPEEEAEKLLKKYHIKPYQIPRIKASDPAAKMIGAKPGDVLKITRKSPTAGKTIVHRYVV